MSANLKEKTHIATSSEAVYFRDSSYRGLLFASAIFAVIAGYAALPKGSGNTMVAALIPGVLAVILVTSALRRWLDKSHTGWFLALDTDGIYVNLAYSAGYSSGQNDMPVLFLPQAEIACIRSVNETMRLAHRWGATRYHFGYLDVVLKHPVQESVLDASLHANDCYVAAGKAGPFPIRFVTPALLRLNWNAINPDEKVAIEHLAQNYRIEEKRRVQFPDWGALNGLQRDIYLDLLWTMGMREEAAFLARMHLQTPIKKAKEELTARAAQGRSTGD